MTATLLEEQPGYTATLNGDDGDTATRILQVQGTTGKESEQDVLDACGVLKYDRHPRIDYLNATGFQVTQRTGGARNVYDVTVTYSVLPPRPKGDPNQGGKDDENEDPTKRPVQVSVRTVTSESFDAGSRSPSVAKTIQQIQVRDVALGKGARFSTSAGEPVEGIGNESSHLVLSFTDYVKTKDLDAARTFASSINKVAIWDFPKLTLKCITYEYGPKQTTLVRGKKITYYERKIELEENQDTWLAIWLDQGTYYLDGSGNKVTFKDADGNPTFGLLDGTGGKLADGADPVYLHALRNKVRPFALLKLPDPRIN